MPGDSQGTNLLNWLIGAAALVIIIAGFRVAQSLVVPFLISAFLAVICTPALQWLQSKGVPTALALLLVLGGLSMVCLIVGAVAVASIQDFIGRSDSYQHKLVALKDQLFDWLEKVGLVVPEHVETEMFSVNRLVALFATYFGTQRDSHGPGKSESLI